MSPFRKSRILLHVAHNGMTKIFFFFFFNKWGERGGGGPEHTGLSFYTKMGIKVLVGGCYTDHKKVRKKQCS